ncbi:hypothetical protein DFQ27_007544 [Actinomortierella ambigua]|uniref:Fibronectin type-III domain-containing protein n=1 Tax=Actinomortierella ambigua TaxID=1343610 RepID=A0A9P6QLK0_9FUNG|nr:hypothetical protein DFQ27_007544 [Actinomortierella ambigua]
MCVTNAIVYYTVPFSFTSPFATGVAFGLMVSLIHGLNLKGVILAMTMYMLKPYLERQTFIEALNPPTLPSMVILAPLAAFCSAFGVLWLLYDLFGYLHASTDDLRDFFGITQPSPSIVTLKEVKDRSITLTWQCASQATISKHLIEIDGLLVGESGKQETSVVIQGLYPDNVYRIRLWAITTRNWKTPSDYIVVRTLASVPIELELSSAENTRKAKETDNLSVKDQEAASSTASAEETPSSGSDSFAATTTTATTSSTAMPADTEVMSTKDDSTPSSVEEVTESTTTPPQSPPAQPPCPAANPNAIAEASKATKLSAHEHPATPTITESQLDELRSELAAKENHHATLIQQIKDTEDQYRRKEEQLRKEISRLRDQQKAEEEPRQQAKNRMKELQDSLRETELLKSKIEKEHKAEVEKRQKAQGQLDAKNKMLETLRKTLHEKEARLKSEKETHQRQKRQLEQTLEKRTHDVKIAMASLTELQASQVALKKAIDDKEKELNKLQTTLNPPKTPSPLETTKRELDQKNTELLEQLEQYKRENQQLQERLTEATKGVAKAREARAKTEAQLAQQEAKPAPEADGTSLASTWNMGDWSQGLGPFLWQGIVQDDAISPQLVGSARKGAENPPPGLQSNSSGSNGLGNGSGNGNGDGTNSLFSSSKFLPPSPSQTPQHLLHRQTSGGHGKKAWSTPAVAPERGRTDSAPSPTLPHFTPRNSQAVRPRSTSIISTDSTTAGIGADDSVSPRIVSASAIPTSQAGRAQAHGRIDRSIPRSRTSSISSLNGIQSPLFENSTLFGVPSQQQQPHQVQQHQQRPHSVYVSQPKYQGTPQLPSSPGSHMPPWGQASQLSTKMDSGGAISSTGGAGGDARLHQHITNYPRFFGSPFLMESAGSSGRPIDEKNVIQSMFESPDYLDLRGTTHTHHHHHPPPPPPPHPHHHLRTMGSHGSLTSQARMLPSHLRSISTPGASPSQSSPPMHENGSGVGLALTSSPSSSSSPSSLAQSTWDPKAVARPGTLGRLGSQAGASVTSLHTTNSDVSSSPTSPPGLTHPQYSMSSSAAATAGGIRRTACEAVLDRDPWSSSSAFGPSPFLFQHPNSSASSLNSPHGSVTFGMDASLALGGGDGGSGGSGYHRETSRLSNDYHDWSSVGSGGVSGVSSVSGVSGGGSGATPSALDALSFADQYFSSRTQRGFEAPSPLIAVGLSTSGSAPSMTTSINTTTNTGTISTTPSSLGGGPLSGANAFLPSRSFAPRVTSRTVSTEAELPGISATSTSAMTSAAAAAAAMGGNTAANGSDGGGQAPSRSSSDAFGFGLWFNPLEWSTNVSDAPAMTATGESSSGRRPPLSLMTTTTTTDRAMATPTGKPTLDDTDTVFPPMLATNDK